MSDEGVIVRKTLVAVLLVFVCMAWSTVGQTYGKDFPAGPIEVVIPMTAGSTMDLLARLIANTAPKYLGQPLVVVNKPGAGGSVAAAYLISSKPDGYKLMVTTNFFFASTTKTQKVPFDPYDLTPIANFIEYRNGFVVKGDSPWKTFSDVVDFARKNPGKLRWAHTGRGISQHMYGLIIFRKANVETIDIPYKGTPEALSALLGGHVEGSVMVYGPVAEQVRSGAVRYLLAVSERRYSNMPNVPTVVEAGYPEAATLPTYVGLYAHKDTPEAIRKALTDAMRKTYQDPEFQKGLEALGEQPRFEEPDSMKKAIKSAEVVALPILKEFGLYVGGK
jgi:tripartite-type tricarboxylate transporter receptor subunit TctC